MPKCFICFVYVLYVRFSCIYVIVFSVSIIDIKLILCFSVMLKGAYSASFLARLAHLACPSVT